MPTIRTLDKKMAALRRSKKAHHANGKLTKAGLKKMMSLAGQKGAKRAKRSR